VFYSPRAIAFLRVLTYSSQWRVSGMKRRETRTGSAEVAEHWQYAAPPAERERERERESSHCRLFIIEQYHPVDVCSESARVTDEVPSLITLCGSAPPPHLPRLHLDSGSSRTRSLFGAAAEIFAEISDLRSNGMRKRQRYLLDLLRVSSNIFPARLIFSDTIRQFTVMSVLE